MSGSRRKRAADQGSSSPKVQGKPGPKTTSYLKRDRKVFGSTFRFRTSPMVIKEQRGSSLWDTDGNEYLDLSAGGAVANTGYCHPAIVEAATSELRRTTHALTPLFPNPPAIELAEKLKGITPGRFEKRVWLGNSGSDAAETVYDFLPAATKRRKVITFFGSHHGLTVGANLLSGHAVSARFLQSPIVTKTPFPYCYRCPFKKGEGCCNFPIEFLEKQVFANVCPPADTACIMVEPIEGLAGELVPPDDFLPQLSEVCDKHGIALVADEVKTSMGRTGKMLAIDHWKVTPDVVILGKPLASGLPLSAVVGRRDIMDSDSFNHLSTTSGHPACCSAALATIEVVREERLAERSARLGRRMKEGFERMMGRHRLIGDVRGKGLFIGVELVTDRKTKAPAKDEATKMVYRAWQRGLILANVGTLGNVIEVTPPLVITKEQVDSALETFEETLTDVEEGRVPDAVLDERSWL
ncbi:MAG: aspartate aminotransferase family protein [Thaumarchaeota archaeon]|nr:aspartate aminotransferase family protein [Nitrososphaerota archaeon]